MSLFEQCTLIDSHAIWKRRNDERRHAAAAVPKTKLHCPDQLMGTVRALCTQVLPLLCALRHTYYCDVRFMGVVSSDETPPPNSTIRGMQWSAMLLSDSTYIVRLCATVEDTDTPPFIVEDEIAIYECVQRVLELCELNALPGVLSVHAPGAERPTVHSVLKAAYARAMYVV